MSDKKQSNKPSNKKGNKKPPETRRPWSFLFWFLLISGLMLVYTMDSESMGKEEQHTVKDLRRDLNRGIVDQVVYNSGDEQFVWTVAGEGTERGTAKKRTAYYSSKDGIAPDLRDLIDKNTKKGLIEEPPSMWLYFLGQLLPWVILGLLFYFLFFRQMRGGGSGGLFNFGKSKAQMVSPENIEKTFADVAGVEEAKEELAEIVDFLKDPSRFTSLGGRLPHGVLLNGPPGTGKTLLAKAIAGEAGVPFFTISGSDFVEMFVGVGASRVRDLFNQAKENSPSIIFLDEIDAVGRKRGSGLGGGHDEREQTLNAILVEMDGFGSDQGVIVIASTNRVDVLDPALLRPGRFDRHVAVSLPDLEGRKQILKVHAKKIKLSTDVDLEVIGQGTPGFSGADLENLLNEAALIAVREKKKAVDMTDLEAARDKVAFGKERKSSVFHEDDLRITAFHESGHALVSLNLPKATPLHKVTIIPRGNFLGAAFYFPDRDETHRTREFFETAMTVAYGGRVAEELIFGDITAGAANDIQQATNIARSMVMKWGMSEKVGPVNFQNEEERMFLGGEISKSRTHSEATANLIDDEVRGLIDRAFKKAKSIIEENQEALTRIAEHLLTYETLSADEVRTLANGGDLDRKPPSVQAIRMIRRGQKKPDEPISEEKADDNDNNELTEKKKHGDAVVEQESGRIIPGMAIPDDSDEQKKDKGDSDKETPPDA